MTTNRKKEPPVELAGVYVSSGISAFTGKGFCPIGVELTDGTRINGQLDPDEVRRLALGWLGAAEAAESDAAVYAELVDAAGMSPKLAGAFIAVLRERRALPDGVDPKS